MLDEQATPDRQESLATEPKEYPSYLLHEPLEHHLVYCRGCGLPFGGKGSMPAVRVSGKGRTAVYAHARCREKALTKPVTNEYVVEVGGDKK